jgi:hypothetical protein
MYNIIDYADHNAGIKEYVVDTIAEMAELSGGMGSIAFCFEDMKFYIKDSAGNWRKMI